MAGQRKNPLRISVRLWKADAVVGTHESLVESTGRTDGYHGHQSMTGRRRSDRMPPDRTRPVRTCV